MFSDGSKSGGTEIGIRRVICQVVGSKIATIVPCIIYLPVDVVALLLGVCNVGVVALDVIGIGSVEDITA